MGEPTKRRVFISFQYEDLKHASLIGAWSANENNDFSIYNERLKVAVDSTNAEYVKRQLRPKIDRASVLVCLVGPTTSKSSWVNWEINYARASGKGLVGVVLSEGNPRPAQLKNVGAMFVPYERAEMERATEWAATNQKDSGDWIFKKT